MITVYYWLFWPKVQGLKRHALLVSRNRVMSLIEGDIWPAGWAGHHNTLKTPDEALDHAADRMNNMILGGEHPVSEEPASFTVPGGTTLTEETWEAAIIEAWAAHMKTVSP